MLLVDTVHQSLTQFPSVSDDASRQASSICPKCICDCYELFIVARSFLLRFYESVSEQFSEMESQVPRTVIVTLSAAISELMHPAGLVPPSKQFVGDHNYGVAKRAFIPPPCNQT